MSGQFFLSMCVQDWFSRNSVFHSSWADFLCCLGPDLPRQTSKPLHHRNPEGHAAEILRLALYAKYGTSPTAFVLFGLFLSSSWSLKYYVFRLITAIDVDDNLENVLWQFPKDHWSQHRNYTSLTEESFRFPISVSDLISFTQSQ